MHKQRYYVLIADLVKSRQVQERKALGQRIEAALSKLTKMNKDGPVWLAPPVTTRGIDEISGVLHSPEHAFDIVVRLNLAIWPQRFRFALGAGEIDVGVKSNNASDMDGSAFHLASDALARGRKNDLGFMVSIPDQPTENCQLLEAAAHLHETFMRAWTPREMQAVAAYRRHGHQADAARQLGVSQQAISDALRRAGMKEMSNAEDAIRAWLGHLTRGMH